MNICLINNFYGPAAKGGAEAVVMETARAARAAGHHVLIISGGREFCRSRLPEGDWIRLATPWLFPVKRWSALWRHLTGRRSARVIRRELRLFRPNLVITHNLYGLGLAALAAPWRGGWRQYHVLHDTQLLHPSGLVYWGQEQRLVSWPAQIYRRLVNRQVKGVKRVISPSVWLLDWHRRYRLLLQADGRVIANPHPTLSGTKRPVGPPWQLLFVGQLEKHKGIEVLLAAHRLLLNKAIDHNLLIAGDGSYVNEIRHLTTTDRRLKYLGKLDKDEVIATMRQAHLLLIPSLVWENAPLVLSEASAVGLPAIGSDCGGIAEMIKDPLRLFEPNSAEELSAAVLRIVKNYQWHANQLSPFNERDYLAAVLAK